MALTDGGFSRTLPKGAVLWWREDPATSLAVVEKGCLGVRVGERLLDIALPGTVLGEASLFAGEAAPGVRTADVVALEADSVVVEYPIVALRHEPASMVHAMVLRTLLYQIARNVVLVRVAHGSHPLLGTAVDGLMNTAARTHERVRGGLSWDEFITAFRLTYRLREASDLMRSDLAPPGSWTPAAVRSELQALQARGLASELVSAVDGFVVLWSSLPAS